MTPITFPPAVRLTVRGLEGEFVDGDAGPCRQVKLATVLDDPPSRFEFAVDNLSSFFLWRHDPGYPVGAQETGKYTPTE